MFGDDADQQRQRIVQARGVADEDARELPAGFEAAPAESGVELDDADRRIEPRQVEAGVAAPAAQADGQPGHARELDAAGERDIPDVGLAALLNAAAQSFVGGELGRVERRHHVAAIRERRSDAAVHAGADVEPRRRNDDGVDERPLDAVEDRRLVTLVDDADRHQQHAGAQVERRLDQDVDVGLLELELAGLFEPFDERVFELRARRQSAGGRRSCG